MSPSWHSARWRNIGGNRYRRGHRRSRTCDGTETVRSPCATHGERSLARPRRQTRRLDVLSCSGRIPLGLDRSHRRPDRTICPWFPGLRHRAPRHELRRSRTSQCQPRWRSGKWRIAGSMAPLGQADIRPKALPHSAPRRLSLFCLDSAGRRCPWHVRLSRGAVGAQGGVWQVVCATLLSLLPAGSAGGLLFRGAATQHLRFSRHRTVDVFPVGRVWIEERLRIGPFSS
jgi:hypothetical protein